MEWFESLDHKTTVVTPNRRLSATLCNTYENHLKKSNLSFQTPDILPFNSFIIRLYHQYTLKTINENTALLLSKEQQRILFEAIIKNSPENEHLIQVTDTAELALSAFTLLKQWQVPHHHPLLKITEDSLTFQKWVDTYQRQCQIHHWLDEVTVIDLLIEKIAQGCIVLPQRLITMGFTELTPQQQAFFKECEQAGSIVALTVENPSRHQKTERITLLNEETELLTMARFAKARYDATSDVTIGCIIPNLEKIRDQVIAVFSELFPDSSQFNISAGKSLLSYPIIHCAFLILGLYTHPIRYDTLQRLLRSPFIKKAEHEFILRTQCEKYLKKLPSYSLDSFKQMLTQAQSALAQDFDKLTEFYHTLPHETSFYAWSMHMMELLKIMGWPGERSVNSEEYQVVQRFLAILEHYSANDILFEKVNYADALHYLTLLTQNTIFQPQSPHAPIQILGLLEAADIPFDYAWVMGLDDLHFPPAAKPNPFIPYPLQKSLNMPHATAERELSYSKRILEQITKQSRFCIVSHAKQLDDTELRASTLIQHFTEITPDALLLKPHQTRGDEIYNSRKIEILYDELAPTLDDDERISGGVNILKQQAACPFRAFAEIRLHAKPQETKQLGLRPEERGQIVHHALEQFWQSVTDSKKLAELSQDDLKNKIHHVAKEAIEKIIRQPIHTLRYHELELNRLTTLLLDWIDIEKKRPDFKVIAIESEQHITIQEIPITIRIDRIDELASGGQLLIDYKTGKKNSIDSFFGERPDEPQLPLYCIKNSADIIGIAYAGLNRHELHLQGIAYNDIGIVKIKPISSIKHAENRSWSEQLNQWKQALDKIASDFKKGHAEIDPKYPQETCQYCQLQGLCRKHEFIEDYHE